jgi:hypothetical protein
MKNCAECKFCCFIDYGYSNYTVEGTEFYCAKKLHPAGHFDRFYGEDKRLEYAETCGGFEAGEAIDMDVEEEGLPDLSEEQREIYQSVES